MSKFYPVKVVKMIAENGEGKYSNNCLMIYQSSFDSGLKKTKDLTNEG